MKTEQLVRMVVFMQGDDAADAFSVMYPRGAAFEPRKTVQYLVQWANDCNEQNVEVLDTLGSSGVFKTKKHILVWNYAFGWVVLYEKVTKKAVKSLELLVLV